jgi:hypothetical protein
MLLQASVQLTMSPNSPFILAHDVSLGILQPVNAGIDALLSHGHGHVSPSLRV